jgi:hypothetical protein
MSTPVDEIALEVTDTAAAAAAPLPAPAGPKDTDSICSDFRFSEVDSIVDTTYKYPESNNSLICDVIAMYLKGQRILYTEAKTHCEQRLNYLMIPTIIVTAICTVISTVLRDTSFGPTLVSSLNGANFFLLALINYLKLDARAEAHRVSAYKFDKILSYVEFNSGKILFETKASLELGEIIKRVQNDVSEVKETNQFILPEAIRYQYPRLHSMNVFKEVKRIQNREIRATNELKDIWNEELALKRQYRDLVADAFEEKRAVEIRLLDVVGRKRHKIDSVIRIQTEYLDIDKAFEQEMLVHRRSITRRYDPCNWLKM